MKLLKFSVFKVLTISILVTQFWSIPLGAANARHVKQPALAEELHLTKDQIENLKKSSRDKKGFRTKRRHFQILSQFQSRAPRSLASQQKAALPYSNVFVAVHPKTNHLVLVTRTVGIKHTEAFDAVDFASRHSLKFIQDYPSISWTYFELPELSAEDFVETLDVIQQDPAVLQVEPEILDHKRTFQ